MTVRLELRRDQRNRALQSFFWVESSQLSRVLGPPDPSAPALLVDDRGQELAWGLYSPESPILFRALSFRGRQGLPPLPRDWLTRRLDRALEYRKQLFYSPENTGYRLVNSEGDHVPGLTIDRYGDVEVIAITTATMYAQIEALRAWAQTQLSPQRIWLVPEAAQKRESFTASRLQKDGEPPDSLSYLEDGLQITCPAPPSQKTGAYHDQRDNRRLFAALAKTLQARDSTQATPPSLDLGSYVGGFSLQMAKAGLSCIAIDQSQNALDYVKQNASLNGYSDKIDTRRGDIFGDLDALQLPKTIASVVIDPPKIVLRPKDRKNAIHGMSRICAQLWPRLVPGGFLALCSCSRHLGPEHLDTSLWGVVQHLGQPLPPRVALWGPGLDHPTQPGHEGGRYLSVAVYQKR